MADPDTPDALPEPKLTSPARRMPVQSRSFQTFMRIIDAASSLLRYTPLDDVTTTRTWQEVMEHIVEKKTEETRRRWDVAIKDKNFNRIRNLKVAETRAEHFDRALTDGKVSTNVYLRRIHNHALGMDWLPVPVLPKKKFPKVKHKEARAIKWEEHCRIVARERNAERRDFYELCWYLGGPQSDIAHLHAEDLDYERRSFAYDRKKTGRMGGMRIGSNAWETILRRPRTCPLFPYLIRSE